MPNPRSPKILLKHLRSFQREEILVVGDFILDIHHFGKPLKPSVENSNFAARDLSQNVSFGGAGLLVRNILELGGKVIFVSLVGQDEYGRYLEGFKYKNLKKFLITDAGRKTTVKQRFWIGHKLILKWNHLDNGPLGKSREERILKFISQNRRAFDKLVISDHRHGLISKFFAPALVKLARKLKKPVYVDSQVSQKLGNHNWYKGADLICLNEVEARAVYRKFSRKNLKNSLGQISRLLRIPSVVVKLGENGSAALSAGEYFATPAHQVKAKNPLGAGDAFLAALCLAPYPPSAGALEFSNIWAGLSTRVVGTEPPKLKELQR